MTTTVRDATEQQQTGPVAMIEKYRGDLATVLPSHLTGQADTWVRVAMGAIRKNTDLWTACKVSPNSMMSALMEAARLGLEPGTDEYYLTPRKVKGQWEVLGIVGYQGEIELMYRAGAAASVIVEAVHENDHFEWDPGTMDRPAHRPPGGPGSWFTSGDRGAVIGCYAYAVMADTGAVSKVVIVDDERIKRAIASSPTASSSHSPWKTDYKAMVLKTGAHDLTKWVPTSAEYRREKLRAQGGDIGRQSTPESPAAPSPAGFIPPPSDVIDGEVVDEPPAEEAPAEKPAAASRPPSKTRMNRLFALLAEAGAKTAEARHRLATHALDRDVHSFTDLTADEVNQLIKQLEQAKAEGKFPAPPAADQAAAPPPDEPPAAEPEQHADTEGDPQ